MGRPLLAERWIMSSKQDLDTNPQGSLRVECVVNGPIQTNTYFAISQGEALVIDPAWEGERLVDHFSQKHPDVRIVGLVATHGHADHVGGVAGMRRALGQDVPFYVSRSDAGFIPGALRGMKTRWGIDTEEPPAPDVLLDAGDTVPVGDVRLQVIDAAGHTPGGIVLFAATQQGNFAFTGDTLFPGGHGRTDLEGGDEAEIMRTLAKLFTILPEDTLCLIGHNDTTTVAEELRSNLFVQRALRHAEI